MVLPVSTKFFRSRVEGPEIFSGTEHNSSGIMLSEQNFEQNKRFL